jgi:hypothetical protein
MVNITGKVEWVEKTMEQVVSITGKPTGLQIPILNLRLITPDGIVEVRYKGELIGIINSEDQVRVTGIKKEGVVFAESIFNETTNSWVAPKRRNCFIQTAVCDSPHSLEINIFEKFRDEFISNLPCGRYFIDLYYILSSPFTSLIKKNRYLRETVRVLFLQPISQLIRNFLKML